jgi:hypothetical protein
MQPRKLKSSSERKEQDTRVPEILDDLTPTESMARRPLQLQDAVCTTPTEIALVWPLPPGTRDDRRAPGVQLVGHPSH